MALARTCVCVGGGHKAWKCRWVCRALKDGLTVQTINAAVGRETPTAPAGNYSQHSVRWERSQDAEVTNYATRPPLGAVDFYLHIWPLYKLRNTITVAIVAEWPPHM